MRIQSFNKYERFPPIPPTPIPTNHWNTPWNIKIVYTGERKMVPRDLVHDHFQILKHVPGSKILSLWFLLLSKELLTRPCEYKPSFSSFLVFSYHAATLINIKGKIRPLPSLTAPACCSYFCLFGPNSKTFSPQTPCPGITASFCLPGHPKTREINFCFSVAN